MINIPVETVLTKLKENGLSDEEIETKIKQKMDQLSGLISREGAAHIIANEMGIKVLLLCANNVHFHKRLTNSFSKMFLNY